MSIRCQEIYSYINYSYGYTKQIVFRSLLTLKEIKQSPDAFQKVLLVALSAIRAVNYQCQTNYLPALLTVLDAAPAFDFYAGFRLPSYFLHPYCAERFDEYDLLDQLEVVLCNNWWGGALDGLVKERDPIVRRFLEKELKDFLEWMIDQNVNFESEEEVRSVLTNWLKNRLKAHPQEGFNPEGISINDLKVNLQSFSIIEKISMSGLFFADIVCIPDFLQTWGVVDLTPIAKAIGGFSLFSWVPNQNLGDWVWRGLCIGFAFQFIQAAQALSKGNLSPAEAKEVKWTLVASAAECALCMSNLLRWNNQLINGLALIAKSLGVVVFLVSSKRVFFGEDKELCCIGSR